MFTGDVMWFSIDIKNEDASYLSEETVDVERDYNLSATETLQEVNTVLPEREYLTSKHACEVNDGECKLRS